MKRYIPLVKALAIQHKIAIFTCLAVLLLRFWPMLFGKVVLFGDDFTLLVPGKLFTAQWLKQGVLPLQNPTIMGGIPWFGDINQSMLYPSTLLFMLFDAATAVSLNLVFHTMLGFFGMYAFGLSWFSPKKRVWASVLLAIFWTMNPLQFAVSQNMSIYQTLGLFPWLLSAFTFLVWKKQSITLAALLFVLTFAAGYPQLLLHILVLAFVYYVWRNRYEWKTWRFWLRGVFTWLFAAVLGLGLGACLILPSIETIMFSTRTMQTAQQLQAGAMFKPELLKLIIPTFWDDPSAGMRWGYAYLNQPNALPYWSWIPAILAIAVVVRTKKISKTMIGLLLFGCVGFLLALAPNLPGFAHLQATIPLLKFIRQSIFFTLFPMVCWSMVLAELVSEMLSKTIPTSWYKMFKKIFLIAVILFVPLFIVFGIVQFKFESMWSWLNLQLGGRLLTPPFHTMARDAVIVKVILTSLVTQVLFVGIALLSVVNKKKMLIVGCIVLDLFWQSKNFVFFGPRSVYTQKPAADLPLAQLQNPQSRVLFRNFNVPYADWSSYNSALVTRAPFSDSYVDAYELTNFRRAKDMQSLLTPDWNMPLNISSIQGYTTLVPQLTQKIWGDPKNPSINSLPYIPVDSPQLAAWAAKYYVVDSWFPPVKNEVYPGRVLVSNPQYKVYELPALPRIRYEDNTPIDMSSYKETPNSISFDVDNSKHTYVTIADTYHSNWKLYMNGTPFELFERDGMMRVYLRFGQQNIQLRYQPTLLSIGMLATAGTGLLYVLSSMLFKVGVGLRSIRRKKVTR